MRETCFCLFFPLGPFICSLLPLARHHENCGIDAEDDASVKRIPKEHKTAESPCRAEGWRTTNPRPATDWKDETGDSSWPGGRG